MRLADRLLEYRNCSPHLDFDHLQNVYLFNRYIYVPGPVDVELAFRGKWMLFGGEFQLRQKISKLTNRYLLIKSHLD